MIGMPISAIFFDGYIFTIILYTYYFPSRVSDFLYFAALTTANEANRTGVDARRFEFYRSNTRVRTGLHDRESAHFETAKRSIGNEKKDVEYEDAANKPRQLATAERNRTTSVDTAVKVATWPTSPIRGGLVNSNGSRPYTIMWRDPDGEQEATREVKMLLAGEARDAKERCK